jgi:hypothetical protein
MHLIQILGVNRRFAANKRFVFCLSDEINPCADQRATAQREFARRQWW